MAEMKFSVHDLYSELTREGIIFCFCGSASQLIVEGIGETLLQRMRLEATNTGVVGKVFQVFVEQMQNIVTHSAERITTEDDESGELRVGIVIVGKDGENFYVRGGNFVENRHTDALRTRLERLQSMTPDELKALYKEERRKLKEEGAKGSGLGFIDMARKASQSIEFEIIEVDAEKSFFSLTTII
jgi:hypothetical protein